MTQAEQLHAHRWEIYAALFDPSGTITRLADKYGVSVPAMSRFARSLPGAPKRQPGRPRGSCPGPTELTRFKIERAVSMRESGATYEQIGQALGCSREYVRQMLNRTDRHDLIGMGIHRAEWSCLICGKTERRPKAEAAARMFCSRRCVGDAKTIKGHYDWPRVGDALAVLCVRARKGTWAEASEALGAAFPNYAQQMMLRWVRVTGVDASWAWGHSPSDPPVGWYEDIRQHVESVRHRYAPLWYEEEAV